MEYRKVDMDFLRSVVIDPSKWEANGLDPTKGILLLGNNGVGKTSFMEDFALANSKICWGHPNMPTGIGIPDATATSIRRACQILGPSLIQQFETHDLYLDDLGSEVAGVVQNYGTASDPIYEILMIRYRIRKSYKTYITSNNTIEQLTEMYGRRIVDRLHELCNIIILTGQSFRR